MAADRDIALKEHRTSTGISEPRGRVRAL